MNTVAKFIILLFFVVLNEACTAVKTNQYYINHDNSRVRDGFWIENESTDFGTMQSKGKYDKGRKIGTWKTYHHNNLIQKEKIGKKINRIKVYHENGKIAQRGQTKTVVKADNLRWYYLGDWKFYDEKGKLLYTKKYVEGMQIDSISAKK